MKPTPVSISPARCFTCTTTWPALAVKAPLIAPPGTRWAYSSPSTQILARIIRDAVGGPEQTLKVCMARTVQSAGHAQRHAGIRRQRHAAGLVRHAGERAGLGAIRTALSAGRRGRRASAFCTKTGSIFPPQRRSIPTTAPASGPTAASTRTPRAASRMGIPRDAFFASGDLGQRIVILQSQRMVIVRLGDSVDPTGDIRGLGRLVSEVIAATQ